MRLSDEQLSKIAFRLGHIGFVFSIILFALVLVADAQGVNVEHMLIINVFIIWTSVATILTHWPKATNPPTIKQ